jgi:hypothetical protein
MYRNCDCQIGPRYGARYSIWVPWFLSQFKGLEELIDLALAARKIRNGLDRPTIGKFEGVWKLRIISSRVGRSLWTYVGSLRKTYRQSVWKLHRVR